MILMILMILIIIYLNYCLIRLLIFQLDYSALMGYTGAIFEKFFGTLQGTVIIGFAYLLWIGFPSWLLLRKAQLKDF